ncbi:MAG: AsmA-like C-terminal region-containing protein, partial [Pseudomonadota bacterium]
MDIGGVSLTAGQGAGQNLQLNNLVLRDAAGQTLLQVPTLLTSFSIRDLLAGAMTPDRVSITDTRITLRRDRGGRISLVSMANTAQAASDPWQAFDALLADRRLAPLQEIDLSGARLSLIDELSGETFVFDTRDVALTRSGDEISARAVIAVPDAAETTQIILTGEYAVGDDGIDIAVRFFDARPERIADLVPAVDWLRNIDTQASGSVRARIGRDGTVGAVAGVLDLGKGRFLGAPTAGPVQFDQAKAYFTYNPASEILTLTEVDINTSSGSARASGYAVLDRGPGGAVTALTGQIAMTDLRLVNADLFDMPVHLGRTTLDARLSFDPLKLEVGALTIRDGDFTYRAEGSSTAGTTYWRNAYRIGIDRIDADRLKELWPLIAVPKTRDWLMENVVAGQVTDFAGALRTDHGDARFAFDFNVEDANVQLVKTVPYLENGRGYAALTDRDFRATLTSGYITAGNGTRIALKGSEIYIPDIVTRPTPGEISLVAEGGVAGLLHVLNSDRFRFIEKAGLTPDVATGRVRAKGDFALPLAKGVKLAEVALRVRADISEFQSLTLVPDRRLAADKLTAHVTGDAAQITGDVMLDGVPMAVTWDQPFAKEKAGASTVRAWVPLATDSLAKLGVPLPPGLLSGSTQGQVRIDLKRGAAPALTLESDLVGARVQVSDLGVAKAPGTAGSLRLRGTLGPEPTVDDVAISFPGLTAAGRLVLIPGGGLERAELNTLRVGRWLNIRRATLTPRGTGSAIKLAGGSLDLRGLPSGGNGSRGSGGSGTTIEARLDRVVVTSELFLSAFQGSFSTRGGLGGRFQGRVNGGIPLSGRMVPQPKGAAIELTATDAGGVLASANLLHNVRDGAMTVQLIPRTGRGNYDGALKLKNVRMKDASAIAGLLNAVSVVGLLQQLQGEGIHFSTVDGNFRLRDGAVELKKLSAVGPSMGITLDGWYDTRAKTVDFEGVTTPLYAVNGVFERLFGPLVGRRKGEGMFSFTYRMRGPAKDPRVSVNPFSILTPGAFREIFRTRAPAPPPGFVDAAPAVTQRST